LIGAWWGTENLKVGSKRNFSKFSKTTPLLPIMNGPYPII
jgi:hypothetical protein